MQVIASEREVVEAEVVEGGLSGLRKNDNTPATQGTSKLDVIDKHFSEVAGLVKDYLEIQNTKAKTDQMVALMEEKRKMIFAEAEKEVSIINAKTRQITEPMEKVILLLQELQSNKLLTSEDMKDCIIALFDKTLSNK